MSKKFALRGLVAATFTPMHADGSLNLAMAGPMIERLLAGKVSAAFACGTTGECASLTSEERRQTLCAFIDAAAGRMPVIAHVGHSALADSCELAAHAQAVGAAAVATTPPYYFRPDSVDALVECMAQIAAAAPELPFYYYHIPHLTGVALNMQDFLRQAAGRIPNLVGIKYTAPTVYEFHACAAYDNGRYDLLFGCDEMLLSGIATGAQGAVGSTYNLAPRLYHRIRECFESGQIEEARRLQLLSVRMVDIAKAFRPLPALKAMLGFAGCDFGPTRMPLAAMRADEIETLRRQLDEIGFLEWMTV